MKFLALIILLFSFNTKVNAHGVNIKGYKEKNSNYISNCYNKYYGYHQKDSANHWHEVVWKNSKWQVVNKEELFLSDPCFNYEKTKVKFIRCVDGDTALFQDNKEEIKLRFLAVDTPESVHPNKKVEEYAKEASKYTCDMLTNASKIEIEYDSNSDILDKYGRHLGWVWVNDVLLQKIMVQEGYAKVAYVYGNYKYIDDLCQVQAKAIENKKGIWQFNNDIGYCANISLDNKEESNINTYKVTFNSYHSSEVINVIENMTVTKIEPANKKGYKFIGWYLNGKIYNFDSKVTEDLFLEAKYINLSYFYIGLAIIVVLCILIDKKRIIKWKKLLKK